MMMVRCYLAPSAIEGLGVFSHVDIPKGGLVWLFDSRFDTSYFKDDLATVPAQFREFLERYTYDHPTDPELVVLDCDEGRFMNHSSAPSVDLSDPLRGVATRRIAAGEELTCDYAQFTAGAVEFQPPRHRDRGQARPRPAFHDPRTAAAAFPRSFPPGQSRHRRAVSGVSADVKQSVSRGFQRVPTGSPQHPHPVAIAPPIAPRPFILPQISRGSGGSAPGRRLTP